MSHTLLSILVILSLQSQVFSSPALLWSNAKLPAANVHLGTVSSLNLIDDSICALSAKEVRLLLLAVKDFKLEDVQHGTQRNHRVFLNAKSNKENFHFYPNVASDIYSKLSLLPQSNDFKCSKTHFQIVSAKVYENLEDALNTIQTTIDSANQDQTVVVALTSIDTVSRKRRATEESWTQVLRSSDQSCMFYVDKLWYNNVTGAKYQSQSYSLDHNASSCVPTGANSTTVNLNLVWKNDNASLNTLTMLLTTILKGRYWYLQNATIGTAKQYRYFAYGMHSLMDTPPAYSYVCNSAVFVRYNATITAHGKYNFSDQFFLTGLQFQPYYSNGSYFGPPNYCTSFFTSGIWMGITSSLLCLAILLFGIHRLMSIKSNDRFDDPKGKPLIIKAQE